MAHTQINFIKMAKCVFIVVFFALGLFPICYGKWSLYLEKFEPCPGTRNLPILYRESEIFYKENGDLYMHQNISVRQDITTPLEVVWYIEKCASREKLDTCMKFYNFKSSRYCHFVKAKGEIWSSFIDCISPTWECPIMKGEYKARNCTFDMSLFRLFTLPGSYWRCKIMLNSVRRPKIMKACVTMEGGVRTKN